MFDDAPSCFILLSIKSTDLATRSCKTMSQRPHRGREKNSGPNEGAGVGAEVGEDEGRSICGEAILKLGERGGGVKQPSSYSFDVYQPIPKYPSSSLPPSPCLL